MKLIKFINKIIYNCQDKKMYTLKVKIQIVMYIQLKTLKKIILNNKILIILVMKMIMKKKN